MRAQIGFPWALGIVTAWVWAGCGGDDGGKKPSHGSSGGTSGAAGTSSKGGTGGTGGGGGRGGSAGASGSAGRGGTSAGEGGAAGSGGANAGAGGESVGGEAGMPGGSSGTGGTDQGGSAGTPSDGGAAGEAGAPNNAGAAGEGGVPGGAGAAGDSGATGDAGAGGGGPNIELKTYSSQPVWAAENGCASVTALYFDGPTELNNRFSNDPLISPSYVSLGVDFLPFPNTAVYPRILRGQQGQIALPNHDGLLANTSSPNPISDLNGRAIHAQFLTPVRAVGVHVNNGDGGALEAYDSQGTLILSAPLASGGFAGITSPSEIARVRVMCTFNADIKCGYYGFQFCDP